MGGIFVASVVSVVVMNSFSSQVSQLFTGCVDCGSSSSDSVCGNNMREGAEVCDLGRLNGDPNYCCTTFCQQRTDGGCGPGLCRIDPGDCGPGSMYADPGTNTLCNYQPTVPTPTGNWYQNQACTAGGVAGTCTDGETCTPNGSTCGNGVVEAGEQCEGGTCCNATTCQYEAGGTVCRAQNGACDVAETCTGTSAACPANAFQPNTTVCRAANGQCDREEKCNGTSGACPADGFELAGTVCRAAVPGAGGALTCDVAEVCSGTTGACPPDGFRTAATVCRAAVVGAGGALTCDTAENCSGSSATCPADAFLPPTTVCRAQNGPCDVAETCSGSAAACPANAFMSAGTICRSQNGLCDAAETCNGTSGACPANAFLPNTIECRPSAGQCDRAEKCNGTSGACPADAFQASTFTCRAAAGVCDNAERCTGTTAACPTDAFKNSSTVCRASAGACDVVESCSGSAADCPQDAFTAAGTVCRAQSGACDVAETCSGNGAACPANAFQPSSFVCAALVAPVPPSPGPLTAAGRHAVSCNGTSATCPAPTNVPITIAAIPSQTGTVGTAVTPLTVPTSDGDSDPPYNFSATNLPAGLSINVQTGVISGTPTTAGVRSVTVTARDGFGGVANRTFTWTIGAAPASSVSSAASSAAASSAASSAPSSAGSSAASSAASSSSVPGACPSGSNCLPNGQPGAGGTACPVADPAYCSAYNGFPPSTGTCMTGGCPGVCFAACPVSSSSVASSAPSSGSSSSGACGMNTRMRVDITAVTSNPSQVTVGGTVYASGVPFNLATNGTAIVDGAPTVLTSLGAHREPGLVEFFAGSMTGIRSVRGTVTLLDGAVFVGSLPQGVSSINTSVNRAMDMTPGGQVGSSPDELVITSPTTAEFYMYYNWVGDAFTLYYACPGSSSAGSASSCAALPQPGCGNGHVEGNEMCDDGNTTAGDGCSTACQTEPGWQCNNAPVTQMAQASRAWFAWIGDLWNAVFGRPDTLVAQATSGWGACGGTAGCGAGQQMGCPQAPLNTPYCFNGQRICCQSTGCTNLSGAPSCIAASGGGTSSAGGGGNSSGGNQSSAGVCTQLIRSTCSRTSSSANSVNSSSAVSSRGSSSSSCPSMPTPGCGNRHKEGAEQCDDGNIVNGDGCSSTCVIETGWQCAVPSSGQGQQSFTGQQGTFAFVGDLWNALFDRSESIVATLVGPSSPSGVAVRSAQGITGMVARFAGIGGTSFLAQGGEGGFGGPGSGGPGQGVVQPVCNGSGQVTCPDGTGAYCLIGVTPSCSNGVPVCGQEGTFAPLCGGTPPGNGSVGASSAGGGGTGGSSSGSIGQSSCNPSVTYTLSQLENHPNSITITTGQAWAQSTPLALTDGNGNYITDPDFSQSVATVMARRTAGKIEFMGANSLAVSRKVRGSVNVQGATVAAVHDVAVGFPNYYMEIPPHETNGDGSRDSLTQMTPTRVDFYMYYTGGDSFGVSYSCAGSSSSSGQSSSVQGGSCPNGVTDCSTIGCPQTVCQDTAVKGGNGLCFCGPNRLGCPQNPNAVQNWGDLDPRCTGGLSSSGAACQQLQTSVCTRASSSSNSTSSRAASSSSCPSLPTPACGNGNIDANEHCDDRNTVSGDGCSSTCVVERGWQCPSQSAQPAPGAQALATTRGWFAWIGDLWNAVFGRGDTLVAQVGGQCRAVYSGVTSTGFFNAQTISATKHVSFPSDCPNPVVKVQSYKDSVLCSNTGGGPTNCGGTTRTSTNLHAKAKNITSEGFDAYFQADWGVWVGATSPQFQMGWQVTCGDASLPMPAQPAAVTGTVTVGFFNTNTNSITATLPIPSSCTNPSIVLSATTTSLVCSNTGAGPTTCMSGGQTTPVEPVVILLGGGGYGAILSALDPVWVGATSPQFPIQWSAICEGAINSCGAGSSSAPSSAGSLPPAGNSSSLGGASSASAGSASSAASAQACAIAQVSACHTFCGDGIKAGTEQCDDRNNTSNDGCSPGCLLEQGWQCTVTGVSSSTGGSSLSSAGAGNSSVTVPASSAGGGFANCPVYAQFTGSPQMSAGSGWQYGLTSTLGQVDPQISAQLTGQVTLPSASSSQSVLGDAVGSLTIMAGQDVMRISVSGVSMSALVPQSINRASVFHFSVTAASGMFAPRLGAAGIGRLLVNPSANTFALDLSAASCP